MSELSQEERAALIKLAEERRQRLIETRDYVRMDPCDNSLADLAFRENARLLEKLRSKDTDGSLGVNHGGRKG